MFLRVLPYHFAYFLIKLACPRELQVTYRNSVYYGYFVCGQSDLDLTISTKLTVENHLVLVTTFFHRYKILKKFFPYIGEVNIYDDNLDEFIGFANCYEIDRDPYLRDLGENIKDQANTIVYLLRMLFSDLANLRSKIELRNKKWNYHLKQIVGPHYVSKKITSIKDLQKDLVDQITIPEYKMLLLSLNERDSLSDKQVFLLSPTEWIIKNHIKENYERSIKEFHFTLIEIDLYFAHLNWEVFGLYSQIFLIFKEHNLDQYCSILLENITLVCEHITQRDQVEKFNSLRDALVKLQSLTRKYISLSKVAK